MSPHIIRKIDDNYPSCSVIDNKPTNKMPGFVGKEGASIIKINSDNAFLNDSSKVVDLNVCIDNQNKVSFIKQMPASKISFMTTILCSKLPL